MTELENSTQKTQVETMMRQCKVCFDAARVQQGLQERL